MKITKSQLKKIIKEELQNVLKEEDWSFPEDEIEVDLDDVERAGHEEETEDLPGGLMDEPRKYISKGQTRKERADEIYRLQQFAKDIANQGITTVGDAWAKLKRISKEIERAREIQGGAYGDPRPGEAGDWPVQTRKPPAVPKVTRTKTGGTRVEEPMEIKPN